MDIDQAREFLEAVVELDQIRDEIRGNFFQSLDEISDESVVEYARRLMMAASRIDDALTTIEESEDASSG